PDLLTALHATAKCIDVLESVDRRVEEVQHGKKGCLVVQRWRRRKQQNPLCFMRQSTKGFESCPVGRRCTAREFGYVVCLINDEEAAWMTRVHMDFIRR